jgi:tRNA-2-methylthio-N6-dimethylallyladenosine synthase
MNEYDSQKLAKILETEYELVAAPEEADLILVNTCSVRDKPEQKLYSLLGEVRDLKARKPGVMIGVGGCVAQQEGHNIVRRSKAVDFVFGTHNLSLVPALIAQRIAGGAPQVAVDYREEWEDYPLGFPEDGRISRFVSISRGCNKNCTYCIVPTTRGKEVSRAPEEIEREVRIAVARGAREIVLLGQTVNSYGLDFSPRQSFVSLLRRVAELPGVERIRFTSPHPQEVRSDFIDIVCENQKICRHIHLPLQSGSDRILKAMNRNYRRHRFLAIVEALRSRVPDMAMTTDIIVGFPGETEEDFEQTLEVMRAVRFQNSFSFIFSPRPGTPAALLESEFLPREIALERLQRLQRLQEEHAREALEGWVGKAVEVLLEGPSAADPALLCGRTSQNLVINLTEPTPRHQAGDMVVLEVVGCNRFTLSGRMATEGGGSSIS